MAAKAAIKDVGRAEDRLTEKLDRIGQAGSKPEPNITLDEPSKQAPQLKKTDRGRRSLYGPDPASRKRLKEPRAARLQSYAAGVVTPPECSTNIVPLYKSNRDQPTTEYDMKGLEQSACSRRTPGP